MLPIELNINRDLIIALNENYFDTSKKLPILIGKIKNRCRDMFEFKNFSEENCNVLFNDIENLQNTLYENKVILNKETYDIIHSYKELGKEFWKESKSFPGSSLNEKNALDKLKEIYDSISDRRKKIIQNERIFKNINSVKNIISNSEG